MLLNKDFSNGIELKLDMKWSFINYKISSKK